MLSAVTLSLSIENGGGGRVRTCNLRDQNPVLFQLSYAPVANGRGVEPRLPDLESSVRPPGPNISKIDADGIEPPVGATVPPKVLASMVGRP